MSAMLDYMQLCRLCLVKEKVNVPIFGDENDVRQIFLKITACLPVKVTQEDNLPKKICDACLYKVDLLYQFWNTTVNAEKQLIQWLTEIGVDVNIKNSDTQTLPILPQSHAHPHSIPPVPVPVPVPVSVPDLKEERPDIVEKTEFQMPEQPNMYPSYDNLGYPQAEVTMEVGTGNTFVQPEPVEEPPPPDPPAPTPKKRGRPAGTTNKKSPPKKKPTPAPPPVVVSPRTNSTRRSSATAAAAAVAAAAAAATDSEEDSDGDRLGGMDYEDSDSDEDHIPKEEMDSDEDYVKPKSFLGVPSSADGEQAGPSGLGGVKSEGSGANATESGSEEADAASQYAKLCREAEKYLHTSVGANKRVKKYYVCPKCPKICQYRSKFLAHSFKHLSAKTCVCPVCNKLFKSKSSLNVHIKVHDDTIYKCNVCQKEYPHKPSYDFHMKFYKSNVAFPCSKCDRKFHLETHLTIHVARDHNNSFTCFSCGENFTNIPALKEHVIIHNGVNTPTKYQCEFCGKICKGRQSRNSHVKGMHLDMHSVMCDICGKKLASKASLNNHILMHRGEKPLACEHCGKTFLLRNTLNIHRRTHTGEKPHGCPYCEKRFTQRNSLVVHIRKHTGDRPFACDFCEEKFVSKSSWKMHRETQHQLV